MGKKFILKLGFILVLIVVLSYFCPTKEDHQKAVDEKVSELVTERLAEDPETALVAALGIGFVNGLVNEAGMQLFRVHSYKNRWIFSTAKIGDVRTFGILGNVFIIKRAVLRKIAEKPVMMTMLLVFIGVVVIATVIDKVMDEVIDAIFDND